MTLAYLKDGKPVLWLGEPVNGVTHPRDIEHAGPDFLKAAGFFPVKHFVTSVGHKITRTEDGKVSPATYELVDGVAIETFPVEPIDPPRPPRPQASQTPNGAGSVVIDD